MDNINFKKNKKFLLSQPLLTKRKYIFGQIMSWLSIILFISIIIYAVSSWHTLKWQYKILITFIEYLLLPSSESLKHLITPYEKYKKEWMEYHREIKQINSRGQKGSPK